MLELIRRGKLIPSLIFSATLKVIYVAAVDVG